LETVQDTHSYNGRQAGLSNGTNTITNDLEWPCGRSICLKPCSANTAPIYWFAN